jgi:hypothetical protein
VAGLSSKLLPILRLAFRPDTLPRAAAATSNNLALAAAVPTWVVVVWAPMIGGGLSEPYSSWSKYVRDSVPMACFSLCVVSAFVLGISALFRLAAATLDATDAAKPRAWMLSAVPMFLPMLLMFPFQFVVRSRGQIFPAAAFTVGPGWDFLGSNWSLLCLAGAWCFMIIHAMRALALPEQRSTSGHCVRCGYDLRGLPGECPECGHP